MSDKGRKEVGTLIRAHRLVGNARTSQRPSGLITVLFVRDRRLRTLVPGLEVF